MLVEKLAQGFSIRAHHALYYESTQQKNIMNGWANYETWNAALWIQNTTAYYETALGCTSYRQFVESVETPCTGDGVKWDDPKIDHEEMDEMLDEFHE